MLQLFSVNPHFIIILFLYLCVSSQLQKKKKKHSWEVLLCWGRKLSFKIKKWGEHLNGIINNRKNKNIFHTDYIQKDCMQENSSNLYQLKDQAASDV